MVTFLGRPRRHIAPARVAGAGVEQTIGTTLIWGVLGFGLFLLIMYQNGAKPDKNVYFLW